MSLSRASKDVGVPMTTIRDWYRVGDIDTTTTRDGQRLVRSSQVHQRATGLADRGRSAPRPSRTQEQIETEADAIAERSRAVVELQGVARDRLEDPEDPKD